MNMLHNITAILLMGACLSSGAGFVGFPFEDSAAVTNWYDIYKHDPAGQIMDAIDERVDAIGYEGGLLSIVETWQLRAGTTNTVVTNSYGIFTNTTAVYIEQPLTNYTGAYTWTAGGSTYTSEIPLTQYFIGELQDYILDNIVPEFVGVEKYANTNDGLSTFFIQTDGAGDHPSAIPMWDSVNLLDYLGQALLPVGPVSNDFGIVTNGDGLAISVIEPVAFTNWVLSQVSKNATGTTWTTVSGYDNAIYPGRVFPPHAGWADADEIPWAYYGTNTPYLKMTTTGAYESVSVTIDGIYLSNALGTAGQAFVETSKVVTASSEYTALDDRWAYCFLTASNDVAPLTSVSLAWAGDDLDFGLILGSSWIGVNRIYPRILDNMYYQMKVLTASKVSMTGTDDQLIYDGAGTSNSFAAAKNLASNDYSVTAFTNVSDASYISKLSGAYVAELDANPNRYLGDIGAEFATATNIGIYIAGENVAITDVTVTVQYDDYGQGISNGFFQLFETLIVTGSNMTSSVVCPGSGWSFAWPVDPSAPVDTAFRGMAVDVVEGVIHWDFEYK